MYVSGWEASENGKVIKVYATVLCCARPMMTDVRTFHYNLTPFGRGVAADVRLPALREQQQQKRKGFKSLVH